MARIRAAFAASIARTRSNDFRSVRAEIGGRRTSGVEKAYNANHSHLMQSPSVRLSELKKGVSAVVREVQDAHVDDPIARRLRELGFVGGEPVRIVATGPGGGDPLLVQIGYTRFALRRAEAARVLVEGEAA